MDLVVYISCRLSNADQPCRVNVLDGLRKHDLSHKQQEKHYVENCEACRVQSFNKNILI